MSYGPIVSFSGTPTITTEKLNGKIISLGLPQLKCGSLAKVSTITLNKTGVTSSDQAEQGKDLILSYVPCYDSMWNPNYWVLLDCLKHATVFWNKAQNIFSNNI